MEARKNARKYAVQAVFQLFFTKGDINKILDISNPYHNQKIEKLSALISDQIDIKQLIST